jgi:hypothetical protein
VDQGIVACEETIPGWNRRIVACWASIAPKQPGGAGESGRIDV